MYLHCVHIVFFIFKYHITHLCSQVHIKTFVMYLSFDTLQSITSLVTQSKIVQKFKTLHDVDIHIHMIL